MMGHSYLLVPGVRGQIVHELFTVLSVRQERPSRPCRPARFQLAKACGSYGQPEFLGGLFLGAIQRDESIDPLASMKPERRSQMRQVKRSWSGDSRHEARLAEIQR